MPPHESDSSRTSPNIEEKVAKEPQPAEHAVADQRTLSELADSHCGEVPHDALCYFLRTHECIHNQVGGSALAQMVQLNPLFTQKCTVVCTQFLAGRFDLPRSWIQAFNFYLNNPSKVVRSLALMAEAHILSDLPDALFEFELRTNTQVDSAQYEAVLDLIMHCFKTVCGGIDSGNSLEDFVLIDIAQSLGLFQQAGRIGIKALRKEAWKAYELQRNFRKAQMARHP